jgi:hypothetical protein
MVRYAPYVEKWGSVVQCLISQQVFKKAVLLSVPVKRT